MGETFSVGGASDDLIYIDGLEINDGQCTFQFVTPGGEVLEGEIEYDGSWMVTLPKKKGSTASYYDDGQWEDGEQGAWREAR
jgi:hypothetical protein